MKFNIFICHRKDKENRKATNLVLNMVAMDSCVDLVIPILPLTAINMVRSKPTQCIFVDCRSFLAYNVAHIRNSLNIHCPPIVRRRLQRGSATLSTLLTCPQSRTTVDEAETLIYYDDGTYSELDNDMTIHIVASLLQREGKSYKHFVLKGKAYLLQFVNITLAYYYGSQRG